MSEIIEFAALSDHLGNYPFNKAPSRGSVRLRDMWRCYTCHRKRYGLWCEGAS